MNQKGRVIFLLSYSLIILMMEDNFANSSNSFDQVIQVKILGDETVLVDVTLADTPTKRRIGLSNKAKLPQNNGLLLDFTRAIRPKIWMKDTRFSLDILFIKSDGEITQIKHRAEPYSLDIIYSKEKVRYVLEINGGEASFNDVNVGDRVQFIIK